jgi:hypothetical protein
MWIAVFFYFGVTALQRSVHPFQEKFVLLARFLPSYHFNALVAFKQPLKIISIKKTDLYFGLNLALSNVPPLSTAIPTPPEKNQSHNPRTTTPGRKVTRLEKRRKKKSPFKSGHYVLPGTPKARACTLLGVTSMYLEGF